MSSRTVHYVLSTHWDREWYQHFQDFRHRLVELLVDVIKGFEQGVLQGPFTMDGQVIPIEDYLEVRPEKTDRVMELIREGSIVLGPWYVLPDEWLVSGESMVRNLELGRAITHRWGGVPSSAGLVCDSFGHVSQLPQLFAGFGMQGAFLWRGVAMAGRRHFKWTGADGTTLPCYRFGRGGYCDYAFRVRRAQSPDTPRGAEALQNNLRTFIKEEAEANQLDPILAFDGGDHQSWDREAYDALIAVTQELSAADDQTFNIQHSTLDAYLEDALPQADRITESRAGELRETARLPNELDWQCLIAGVLASRPWIKQENAYCQTELCHWAEPMGVLAETMTTHAYPAGFLDLAWKWLLKNHPHDSICGCSIDEVHEAMRFRFMQCRQIAERQTYEAMKSVAVSIVGGVKPSELRVVAFNPLPRPMDEVAELALDLPTDWPQFHEFFGYEKKTAFRVYDPEGREVAYQLVSQRANRSRTRLSPTTFPAGYKVCETTIALRLSIPAVGYTTLTLKAGDTAQRIDIAEADGDVAPPTRHPTRPSLVKDERTLENEHLRVSIESDGSLTLTDKKHQRTYSGLLTFEDMADIGDGWNYCPPVNDTTIVSTGSPFNVSITRRGPLVGELCIRMLMRIPAAMDWNAMQRSDQCVDLPITTRIRLTRDAEQLHLTTTVDNTARDHRLRVLIPSGARDAMTYIADSAFDVVERPIAMHTDNDRFRELEVEGRPQQTFTAVADSQHGMAVISAGMMESAVLDRQDRAIAFTILRATKKTVMTDGEPGGQVLGEMTFKYAIRPIDAATDRADLCLAGQRLAVGCRTIQLDSVDAERFTRRRPSAQSLPATSSLCAVEGPLVLTSLRRTTHGYEARLFNPRDQTSDAQIRFGIHVTSLQQIDFTGKPVAEKNPSPDCCFSVRADAKQIVTYRICTQAVP